MSTIVTRSGKGSPLTHVEVDANFTNLNTDKYQEGSAIGATTPAAGTFTTLTATGQTSLGGAFGSESFRAVTFTGTPNGWIEAKGSTTSTNGSYLTSTASSFYLSTSGGNFRFFTNVSSTLEQLRVSHTASAVNYVQVTGAATGGFAAISTQGSDASVGLNVISKGALGTTFATNGSSTNIQFRVLHAASAVNRVDAVGSATGIAPVVSVSGSDTNISQVFQSKGTGAIDLAAGSSGVNISNGGTVTAITRTAAGTAYTTVPSVAITAPTTAGGVQATATCTIYSVAAPTVNSGGTGYTVGDVLTLSGGTYTSQTTFTVATVSAGVITSLTSTATGNYTVPPSFPASVTGGTGTGATVTPNFGVNGFTITNAGSGYVEQPTVTFSGGGGSGAAAYATVGSGTTVKSLGTTGTQGLDFHTAASATNAVPAFRISNATATSYPMTVYPTAGFSGFLAQGDTNGIFIVGANGNGSVRFTTSGTSYTEQLRVSHTASAVNYVQVTGAATGGVPTISAQGSDTNVKLRLLSKNDQAVEIYSNSKIGFAVYSPSASAVNYFEVNTATAGNAPVLKALGSDTNIDLALTPKGTGLVRFGTYTANMALTIQGYIEIKDSGGTTRRLAVIA